MINEFAMNNFVIEKGIDRESQRIKWPYARMEIGESVFIPLNFSGGDYGSRHICFPSPRTNSRRCSRRLEIEVAGHTGLSRT